MDARDTDRLELLDRLADRVPELDLDQNAVEWIEMPDGAQGLAVDGGGVDGGNGVYFANAGDDVHVVGSLMPLAPAVGCIVVKPDGTRVLAHVEADPLRLSA